MKSIQSSLLTTAGDTNTRTIGLSAQTYSLAVLTDTFIFITRLSTVLVV